MSQGRAARAPERFDPSIPVNAAKLEVVEELVKLADELGRTLPELAVAFVVSHPAVTSVILGPRTMEQLEGLLKGASLVLGDTVLDRIGELVPPGTDVYPPVALWSPAPLTDPALRRRPPGDRSAS
ncbi:aldo/keto reductase [Nonomuraea ferruginea]